MRREFQQQIAMEQGWVYAKKRDLQLPPFNLPKEKAEQLAKASDWIQDPNFPDDEEERMYWVRENIALNKKQERTDTLEMKGSLALDQDQANDLLADGAFFAADSGPSILGMSDDASSKALNLVDEPVLKKKKKKDHTNNEVPASDLVQDALGKADAAMKVILKDSTEAKELELKIDSSATEFGQQVCKSLRSYHTKQDELYTMFKKLRFAGNNDEAAYEKLHNAKDIRIKWFADHVRPVATSLVAKLGKGKKGPGKRNMAA